MSAVFIPIVLFGFLAMIYYWLNVVRWFLAIWIERLGRGEEYPGRRFIRSIFMFWGAGVGTGLALFLGKWVDSL